MRKQGLLGSEDGSAMVEFACVLPVFVLVLAGMVDYSLNIEQRMRVTEGAAMGAAYGSIAGNQQDAAGMRAAASAGLAGMTGLRVEATSFWTCSVGGAHTASNSACADGSLPMQWVQVETIAKVEPLLKFPGIAADQDLHGLAVRRVARRS